MATSLDNANPIVHTSSISQPSASKRAPKTRTIKGLWAEEAGDAYRFDGLKEVEQEEEEEEEDIDEDEVFGSFFFPLSFSTSRSSKPVIPTRPVAIDNRP